MGTGPLDQHDSDAGCGRCTGLGRGAAARFYSAAVCRLSSGGQPGTQLKQVTEIMRPRESLRLAQASQTVREVFVSAPRPGRRTGAVLLLDEDGALAGLFTDSDLARLMEQRRNEALDRPISEVMTARPLTLHTSAMFSDVVALLSERKISEIPVVDDQGVPSG